MKEMQDANRKQLRLIHKFYISGTRLQASQYLRHWRLLLSGYIGTLALYAHIFGVYAAAMFRKNVPGQAIHHLMETE
jgi:hypothetical protein